MRVIFLDIDGVLNSHRYDQEKREKQITDGGIDLTRLPLVKRIMDETGAQVVLSSSWRDHWDKDPALRDAGGVALDETFRSAGIVLWDKTPDKIPERGDRAKEISLWLEAHPEVTEFVILDDTFGGWGDLADHVVKTDYRIERGLEERHVEAAIRKFSL